MFSKPTASRRQIAITRVQEGVLVLPKEQYRCVLQTSALNFELKSDAEQDQILDTFQSALNALPCSIQIVIKIRELDIEGYIDCFNKSHTDSQTSVHRKFADSYYSFVRDLVEDTKILSREFYIVLGYQGERRDFTHIQETLSLHADIVSKNLERVGIKSRRCSTQEIVRLFHRSYNEYSFGYRKLSEQHFEGDMYDT